MSTQKKIANAAAERLESFQAKQTLETAKASRRKSDNRLAVMFGVGAVALALVGQFAYFSFGPGVVTESTEAPTVENSEVVPDIALAESRVWIGSMNVGEATLELELDGVNAPQAVANFISLSQSGFYEGVSCHRLVTDGIYVLQCGDPDGTGGGGPGYNFGPIENAPADDSYVTGSLAMARVGGDGNSMGSQFFIVYQDSRIPSDAAGGYTIFGKITSGLDGLEPVISAGVEGGATDGPPALETLLSAIELR
ncbi:type peptidyl-prolyl cis-trans isomerase cyclophilin [freshwater metagenome]|uniref:peptidylprolyl isomerase n=1 Tax=freshwater metagenome TaxID=449393 RepID=A0A094PSX6_9ZZZZ